MSLFASSLSGKAATDAALEAGRILFASPCEFFAAAGSLAALPVATAPEIAFAGRSNVGKSSLLNALVGQSSLARTSGTPGRTRELVFFSLAERLVLVDMPGYGYAKAAKKLARAWQGLARAYLRGRPNLRRLLLLLDARRGAGAADLAMMDLLDRAAVAFQITLTKVDTLTPPELAERTGSALAIARRHPAALPGVLATSARTGAGIAELRAEIAQLAA